MTRNRSLDVLRGVAVLLVIAFHLLVPGFRQVGRLGVDLFFVLSGFLISGLLFGDFQKLGDIRCGRFWFRRTFKIVPPLYAFLVVMAGITLAIDIFPRSAFASAALFYTNYSHRDLAAGGLLWHTWSLAVEEHFYLVCPVLFYILVHTRQEQAFRALPLLAAGLYGACFVLRVLYPDPENAFTHLRIDALFAGVTLRYIKEFRSSWFLKLSSPVALAVGVTFWMPACFYDAGSALLRSAILTWTSLSGAVLIAWCYNHEAADWWNSKPLKTLASIGFYSYSIYLWQQPVALFFRDMQPAIFFKGCGVIFSVAAGVIMSKLVEMPALRLRETVEAGRKRQAAMAATVAV